MFRSQNPFTFIPGYDVDEEVALAGQTGFRPSSSITADNVYINGIALPYVISPVPSVSGTLQGAAAPGFPVMGTPAPFPYPIATFGGVQGEIRQPIISDPIPGTINGQPRLTAAEVASIINFAADRARTTRAGIRLPDVAVPLATYTGWNFRPPAIGAPGELAPLLGSSIPFPATRAAREAARDPRRSIEERYRSLDEYLAQVQQALDALVKSGFLIYDDGPRILQRAQDQWDLMVVGR